MKVLISRFFVLTFLLSGMAIADDWPQFRGLAGLGIATEGKPVPQTWSPTKNLAWKKKLPGPGASSPIIVGGKVFVTCYSGYGVTRERESEIEDLVRHLVCVDLKTGDVVWQRDIHASLPEDSYYDTGVSSHGYASHTPCSDGTNVYCFFGKGGVFAFDVDGNELWQAGVGKESDPPKWGSSSSPILHNGILVITAAAESQSIIGFDKATGQKLWQQEATGLDGMWGTPSLVRVDDSRRDLVMLVPGELWGLDPDSGKLRWHARATSSRQAYTSIISHGPRVFAFSGQGGGSIALDVGGSGEVSDTNTCWTSTVNAIYASPVYHKSMLYVFSRGTLSVVDAENGRRLNQVRLKGAKITGNARFGSLDYASPVIVGDYLFYLNASGQMYVFRLGKELEQLAVNTTTTEKEIFWGSPAVSDGTIVLRSSKHLYCVSVAGQAFDQDDPQVSSVEKTEPRPFAEITRGRQRSLGYNGRQQGNDENPTNETRPDRPRRPESAAR
ncbi:MAG: PQQ-binding-like beta-propeller repeat protein [Rubripirellula sp.]|nr:PQQ-binding-like beta-propeller repeat protein [Rubripirellula sp.]